MQKKYTILYISSMLLFIVFSMGILSVFGITSYVSDTIYTYINQDTGGEVAGEFTVGMTASSSDVNKIRTKLLATIRCPSTAKLKDIIDTPVGEGWHGDNPTEWKRAGVLISAYGCSVSKTGVKERLIKALDFAEENTPNMNNCSKVATGWNWWQFKHGIPTALRPMVYGGDKLPSDIIKQRVEDFYWHFSACVGPVEGVGADAATSALDNLYSAIYFDGKKNQSDYAKVFSNLKKVGNIPTNITYKDGFDAAVSCINRAVSAIGRDSRIRPDWSFFYHGAHINSQYSARIATDMSNLLYIIEGTELYNRARYKDDFIAWFKNWNQWTTYLGEVDPIIGHKWSYRPCGHKIIDGAKKLLKISGLSNSDKSVMNGIINKVKEPYGAISYPLDSYLVARKPNFFAGIRLISLDMPNMEASSFSPWMGSVNVMTPTNIGEKISEWRDSNVKKYPFQILGLTTLTDGMSSTGPKSTLYQPHNFSSPALPNYKDKWGWYGVTTLDGNYSLAAQNYDWNLKGGNMKLQKAWFVFNDEILTTQTGDTKDSGAKTWMLGFKRNESTVQTPTGAKTLPSSSGQTVDLGTPNWVHTNNFGYVFLRDEKVKAEFVTHELETKDDGTIKNSVYDIIQYEGSNRDRYVRIYADHNETFSSAAVLLPGASKTSTSEYNDIQIIKLDNKAHIVKEEDTGVIGAAIFGSSSAGVGTAEVKSNKPAYIMYKKSGSNLNFSLYNPHLEEEIPLNSIKNSTQPKNDIGVGYPTYTDYEIILPFTLTKASGLTVKEKQLNRVNTGSGLVTPLSLKSFTIIGSKIKVRLRANRMFEFKAVGNKITEAWVGLNDTTGGVVTNPNCTCNTTYSACGGGGCSSNQKLETETCTGGCTASPAHCVNRSECGEPDPDPEPEPDSSLLETCLSLKGSTCSSNQYCNTDYIDSSNNTTCCPSGSCKTKTADLNCSDSSHKIGFKDLTVLIAYWGEFKEEQEKEYKTTTFYKDCGETDNATPDLNKDGKVDIDDFALFLNQWGR